ncbi:MAG: GTP-binding protein, partial [Lentisphaeria bacterium]
MNIRNIGIIAHIDAGKTTLTERILFNTGKIKYCGEVHEGTTVTDYLQEERQRGISILSAAVSCTWKKTQINLIDTPGHVDFTAEVERCLRVMDGCIAVFCAVNGVQAQSEKVWKQANQYKLPAVAFINKMEREGADYNRVIEQIRSRFNIVPLLMQFPCYIDQTFYGAIDMLSSQLAFNTQKNKDWLKIWKETDNAIDYELQREKFIELLAEYDEKILQAYIGNKFPSYEELQNAITKATKRREILPVFCGSVLHNFGVQSLLDASCQYLPAPQETCGAFVKKIQNQKCAFVFKIFQNMFHNDCAAVRIYSGRLKRGDVLKIVRSNTVVTITKIQRINSAELEDLDSANHGDIVVLQFNQLLDFLKTGDTLVEPSLTFELKPIAFPEPVISITFQGISEEDRLKLPGTLRYMSCQDPTLHVFYDTEKGLWTASGMG